MPSKRKSSVKTRKAAKDDIDDDQPESPDGRSMQHRTGGLYDSDSMVETDDNDGDDYNHSAINGLTESGELFGVPPTRDTLNMLMRIHEIPTIITWLCFGLTLYIGLPERYFGYPVKEYFGMEAFPRHYLLWVAIFWRLMYNVVLGYILDYQSRTKGLTEYVRRVTKAKGSVMYKILSFLLRGTLGFNSIEDKPPEFNAWVLNTQLVNVILPNDVAAFLMFALMELNLPGYGDVATNRHVPSLPVDSSSLYWFMPQSIMGNNLWVVFYGTVYIIGATLIITSTVSKMLSHKVIGYYAWFWGDFFFKIDKTLKFDGIFEVFPHPMYTVGYAWMYGSAMIAGSFQVLALTMFSHLMQMAFLGYVEDPHIQRTYGVEFEKTKVTHRENIFIIHNFDPFRASDWMMVIILVLFVTTTIVCGGVLGMDPLVSENYFIASALFITLSGKIAIALLLYKQGKTRFWTSHFIKQGFTQEKAFDEWKRIQNLLDNLVNFSFLVLCWRMFQWPQLSDVMYYRWTYLCGLLFVVMLLGISYWSSNECYSALGDYGWFYGDFFLRDSKDDFGEGYVARGIYRYFSHPDILFGKVWLYALAVLCDSRDVAAIAMIHHALCLAQLITVEEPHMQRIYQRRIKRFGGVMETLSKLKIVNKDKKHK